MSHITTFAEAQNALRALYDNSRTPYTLDAMQQLMAKLGDPQNKVHVIHVAGTSGKTSTAYYAAALLKESGATVGLSVSPHVDTVNERLQVNGFPLSETEFCSVLEQFLDLIADFEVKPSYFELLAAMAYWEFARRKLDYAVMEVGLGGRLDATNVVTNPDKICLITDIGLDHTEILGDTLPEIAGEKAGIIHADNQVFVYKQSQEVMQVIASVSYNKHAIFHMLEDTGAVKLPGLPLFQQRNLGLARQAVNFANLRDGRPALWQGVIEAAAAITIPARLERFTVGNKTIIVDGSHNQQKLQALLASIAELYPEQSIAVLAGFVSGSEARWQGGLDELLTAVQHIIFTSFHSEKDLPKSSVNPEILARYCKAQNYHNYSIENDPVSAFTELQKRPEPVLLVTGSFYLMNHIRPLLAEPS